MLCVCSTVGPAAWGGSGNGLPVYSPALCRLRVEPAVRVGPCHWGDAIGGRILTRRRVLELMVLVGKR